MKTFCLVCIFLSLGLFVAAVVNCMVGWTECTDEWKSERHEKIHSILTDAMIVVLAVLVVAVVIFSVRR